MAPTTLLLEHLGRHWAWIAIRGALAVLFGIIALLWPGITLAALVLVWGAYALVDGVVALVTAFKVRDFGRPMWPFLMVGGLSIAAGVLTFIWPGLTALALLLLIAVWAVLTGIFQIVAAIRLRKEINNEWMLGLSGALSVAFGLLMIASPGAGALAVVWVIAFYAIFFGILLIAVGFKVRRFAAVTA
jgi:uncharacterized membrane protein HdeD (DUF308 family)